MTAILFEKLADHLVETDPTCTNVNDFEAIVFVPKNKTPQTRFSGARRFEILALKIYFLPVLPVVGFLSVVEQEPIELPHPHPMILLLVVGAILSDRGEQRYPLP